MKITFNMATMPSRVNTAIKTIESIYEQADIIRLYLNNFNTIPKEFIRDKIVIHQGDDLKSTGKLFWALNKNEYYFCIDDDLYYPPSYATDMINKLNEHSDNIIVSLHGKILTDGKKTSYFRNIRESFHCLNVVTKDRFVHVIGNGVSAFNTNNISIDYKKFKYLYMDDISVSLELMKAGKRRLVMAHKKDYLTYLPPSGETLHSKYVNNDKTQTEMVNSINWGV